jgi:hypothetical protein
MSIADLAFGKWVWWRGLKGQIVDIRWARTPLVQIRVLGGHTHWTTPDRLEVIA